MNSYIEIPYNKTYNASDMSAKVSCHNMSVLSSKYTQNQNRLFEDKINLKDCEMHHDYLMNVEDIKNNETNLLQGYSINKKSCIYKRPNYGLGEWSDQFKHSKTFLDEYNSQNLFDYQSKAKSTNNPLVCDYSKILLPEECDKGPYFTYSKTFTSDYYNCVV